MNNIHFIFQLSPYNIDKLLPQVSKALEKRTELVSRERFPGLWKNTDRINTLSQGQTQSRLRTRIMSIICLALVPVLVDYGVAESTRKIPLINRLYSF